MLQCSLQHTACLKVYQITIDNFAFLFNSMLGTEGEVGMVKHVIIFADSFKAGLLM